MKSRSVLLTLASCSCLALGACNVGPRQLAAPAPMPEGWAGVGAQPEPGTSVPVAAPAQLATWWTALEDAELSSLIDRAVGTNLTLQQAQARVRAARAARDAAAAGLYPTVSLDGSYSRARTPGGTGNLFRVGLDAAWEIDVFGGTQRAIEAADAGVAFSIEDTRDVLVSLIAEVALTYADLRGTQSQLDVARRTLASQMETASIFRQRFDAGYVSELDVASADAQVSNTRSRIPTLESNERAFIYALSVLLAQPPAALLSELSTEAPQPTLPPEIPVGLPSELLRRRPDIRRAEASMRIATANVGVAVADLFPKFSLAAALGLQGQNGSSLVSLGDRFWSIAPGVSWPIFDAGRIGANIRGQEALADESLATYRQTVLTALQEVETALVAYEKEQQRRASLVQSVTSTRRSVELATLRYQEGFSNFLDVLTAQRALFDAEDSLAQSERLVVQDLVTLYKSLGGGWDDSPDAHAHAAPPASTPPMHDLYD